MKTINIAYAQINPTVGDLDNNLQLLINQAHEAQSQGADLIAFPELSLSGYPPEDLLFRNSFISDCLANAEKYAKATPDIFSIIGLPLIQNGKLTNAAIVTNKGRIVHHYAKQKLPNYGVFDELRYFTAGTKPLALELKGINIGVTICEDLWTPEVAEQTKNAGADILISLNASPFELSKQQERLNVLQTRAKETTLPILYVNAFGGQDELTFDGNSLLLDKHGNTIINAPCFEASMAVFELNKNGDINTSAKQNHQLDDVALIYKALVLGIKDYYGKNKFKGIVIGLSGGIDSALTLALAVAAIGADKVKTVMMPTKFTSDMSIEDATLMAKQLGTKHTTLPISDCFNSFLECLEPEHGQLPHDTTEENIQARCRGVILMAISNKLHFLLLTTGNRSELAVGYATLYGDMAGGFSALKDVYKTQAYDLANFINKEKKIIPQRIIDRPPSAELADDQVDQDSLPPYEVLDIVLSLYLDNEFNFKQIVDEGFNEETVRKVLRMVDINEHKRRQSPPGVRINHKAFGKDRRYPITNGYRDY
jgi:NAD+ synthase (glutamine-hydrolysing)